MLQYILECIAFQLVFLIIYDVFLKRETFFQWNRLYLISTYIISMVLPWIKIEAMKTTVPESFQAYPEFLWNMNDAVLVTSAKEETSFHISWEYALLFGGMLLATLFFGYKLYQIYALRQKGEVDYFKDFTRIIIANSSIAFSFFKSIFLGDKVIEREHQNIVQHELVHIRQRHSYDLIFFELMRIVAWFNPLVYVYQSRISELHEFIADAHVAKTHKKEQYQLLLSEVFQTQHISFINQFFKSSLIKKRIVMLQKNQSKKVWQLKYLLLVPMIIAMLAYTSINQQPNSPESTEVQTIEDAELITKIKVAIEREIAIERSFKKVFFNGAWRKKLNDTQILNKEEYFKEQILFKMMFEDMKPVEFGDDVEPRPKFEMPLPSTVRYKSYVSRKMAFEILDTNLQYSIKAYEQKVGLIDIQTDYPKEFYVFEVVNTKDLTGKELRAFNNKLDEIFEQGNTEYTNIILTDKEFAFKVKAGLLEIDLSTIEKSNNKGYVERTNSSIKLNVFDRKHMTKGEKEQKKELMKEVLNSKKTDTLIISDGNTFSTISSNSNKETHLNYGRLKSINIPFATVDEVPVFPGCKNADDKRACFQESMQRHISKNFRYPEEAQEKGIQGRVSVLFVIDKKGKISNVRMRGPDPLLEEETKRIISRLPNMKPAKHKGEVVGVTYSIPITFKLTEDKVSNVIPDSKAYDSKIDVPFAVVDEIPVFPGCEDVDNRRECFNKMMQKHISKNFNYPLEAQEKGIQGRVSIMFTIGKDGTIQNVRMRGPDVILEKEAARIIGRLPKMTPGKQKGEPVNVPFSIPISFKLQEDINASEMSGIIKIASTNDVDPLFVIDGKESIKEIIKLLNPDDIESVYVLKGEAAEKKYGIKGKNGVVEIITKKKD